MKRYLITCSILIASVVGACGYEAAQQPAPAPAGDDGGGDDGDGSGGGGGGGNETPPTGDALVQKECGRCHQPGGRKPNPQIRTVAEYKRSGGAADVRNGSMPPDKRLDDATKRALLSL